MKSHMKLAQRTLAILSATGTAALMTLPAFAQVNGQVDSIQPNVVQGVVDGSMNGNSGMMNNQSSASDSCGYVTGGIGGPIDNNSATSFDAAQAGVANGTLTLNSDLSVRNSAIGNNTQNLDSSYAAARIGVSNTAGTPDNQGSYTSGNTSSSVNNTQNLDSSYAAARVGIPNTAGAPENQYTANSTTSYNSSGRSVAPTTSQFDGNNSSAAIPYRFNGPAATAGHEAKMNLDAFEQNQNLIASNPYSSTVASNSSNTQASLRTACAPSR